MKTFKVSSTIVLLAVMLSMGFFISGTIHDNVTKGNEKYFKALKVDKDPELFNYAIETSVGGVISHGVVRADKPVSDELIDGKYFAIKKVEEHYVQKTRTVSYTDSNGNRKTRVETYWEWEPKKVESFKTDTFTYLDRELNHSDVKYNNYQYKKTVNKRLFTNVRWVYYTIPTEFKSTLYFEAKDSKIMGAETFSGVSILSLIERKEKQADGATVVFWVVWILLMVASVFGLLKVLDRL